MIGNGVAHANSRTFWWTGVVEVTRVVVLGKPLCGQSIETSNAKHGTCVILICSTKIGWRSLELIICGVVIKLED